jgi:hypothetical protein
MSILVFKFVPGQCFLTGRYGYLISSARLKESWGIVITLDPMFWVILHMILSICFIYSTFQESYIVDKSIL